MTWRAIKDKLHELCEKERRRGCAGRPIPLSDLDGAGGIGARSASSSGRESFDRVEREELVQVVCDLLGTTAETDAEADFFRHFFLGKSTNAAAAEAGLPRVTAQRLRKRLSDRLRQCTEDDGAGAAA